MKKAISRIRGWLVHIAKVFRLQGSNRDPDQRDVWIEQDFWFLVREYGFHYGGYFEGHTDFISERVRVRIVPSRKTPYSFIYRVGEPDFTALDLFGVLEHFESKPLNIDFTEHSLQHNLKFLAVLVNRHANRICNEVDEWWLPLQQARFNALRKEYEKENRLPLFLESYKDWHQYLKHKGAI